MNKIIILFLSDWSPHIKNFYVNLMKISVFFYLFGTLFKEYIINLNDDFTDICNSFRRY